MQVRWEWIFSTNSRVGRKYFPRICGGGDIFTITEHFNPPSPSHNGWQLPYVNKLCQVHYQLWLDKLYSWFCIHITLKKEMGLYLKGFSWIVNRNYLICWRFWSYVSMMFNLQVMRTDYNMKERKWYDSDIL